MKDFSFLETQSHRDKFKLINKRLNEIEDQIKYDIATLSQPVDISAELSSIKKNITLLETQAHPDEFEQINKRLNGIEERMKQLEHDITTPSQPVDLSTYTDQLLSIKESVANNIEILKLLETQSHPEQKETVYTTTELDKLLDGIKNSLNKQIQDVRDQCNSNIRNHCSGFDNKIRTYKSETSSTNEKVENIIYYMYIYSNLFRTASFKLLLHLLFTC